MDFEAKGSTVQQEVWFGGCQRYLTVQEESRTFKEQVNGSYYVFHRKDIGSDYFSIIVQDLNLHYHLR